MKMKNSASIDFKSGFKYPFNRAAGLLNILWMLVPIGLSCLAMKSL